MTFSKETTGKQVVGEISLGDGQSPNEMCHRLEGSRRELQSFLYLLTAFLLGLAVAVEATSVRDVGWAVLRLAGTVFSLTGMWGIATGAWEKFPALTVTLACEFGLTIALSLSLRPRMQTNCQKFWEKHRELLRKAETEIWKASAQSDQEASGSEEEHEPPH